MSTYIYLKDSIVNQDRAFVPATSTLAQYGINVFEGIRGYYNHALGKIYLFKLDDHVTRLLFSAKLLRFAGIDGLNVEHVRNIIQELVSINRFREDIYVKVCLFIDNDAGWSSTSPVSLMIVVSPKGRSFADLNGLSCCVSSWRRINDTCMPPRIKAGPNYLNSRLALLEAKSNGYDYPILLNDRSTVAEGPGACIFIVRNGTLITPPVYASVLESITRQAIIDLSKGVLNLNVIEREIDRTELYVSDEVFFAGTAIEIKSASQVDRIQIGNVVPGEIATELCKLYFDVAYGEVENYTRWLSPVSVS